MKLCQNCGIAMKKDIPLCFACRTIKITNKISKNIENKFPNKEKNVETALLNLQNELLI